jgi:hypothetical protein
MKVLDAADFVWDDVDSNLVILFRDEDGTPIDFTGATDLTLVCERLDGTDQFTITGSIYGAATNGQLKFPSVAQGPAQPNVRERVVYRAIPKWKLSGASDFSWSQTEYRFSVTRYPS